jgi:gliding motility-associated-like protein
MVRFTLSILFVFNFLLSNSQEATQFSTYVAQNELMFGTKEKIQIDYLGTLRQAQTTSNRSDFKVSLPVFGKDIMFLAVENDVVDQEFKRDFPDIKTFDLTTASDKALYGALTLSKNGLYATIISNGKMISIYPNDPNVITHHWIEYGPQPDLVKMKSFCGHDHTMDDQRVMPSPLNKGSRTKIAMGTKKYQYRLALAITGEFYINNGGNDNAVRTVVVNSVNAISAIFNNELSFRLLYSNGRTQLYRDPATDPFIPDQMGGDSRPNQAGTVVGGLFNPSLYDIGHVFHQHDDGDGWGNGGIAQLRSVCRDTGTPISKSRGWSGAYDNVGNGWISLATHEFGHQFGANHTFNGIGGSCDDAIASDNSYEIASGTTIMSYNGICGQGQNIPSGDVLDNYFHIKSLEEMYDYVYNSTGGTCGTPTDNVNLPAIINDAPCGNQFRIPKSTPFKLTANVTQQNGETNNLTYCWEQIDEDGPGTPTSGKKGAAAGSDPRAPLFRSFPPSNTPTRYFPSLSTLVKGGTNDFEPLPSVARSLNFNLSVRDNVSDGGTVANDDLSITVENSGPFVIVRPNGGETINAGSPETITWNTNGSNTLCQKVRIRLSTDGGKSFNTILAENVNYAAGNFSLTLPASFSATTNARLMVECMDNECYTFFNISAQDFTINSSCLAQPTVIKPIGSKTLLEGDPGLNLMLTSNTGGPITNISGNVRTTDLAGNLVYIDVNSCGISGNPVRGDLHFFTVSETGSYTIAHGVTGPAILNLYEVSFNGTNCDNHVSSTGIRIAPGDFITPRASITVSLVAGRHYYIFISGFNETQPAMPFNYNITFTRPPGAIVYGGVPIPSGYKYTYVAVDKRTNLVAAFNDASDFTTIKAGEFCVYGVLYKDDNNINTWIGKTFLQIIQDGSCLTSSAECYDIKVLPNCRFNDIVAVSQTPCVIGSNEFTQTLTLTYERAPTTGKINVNGQLFDVTTSPQTVTLTGLDSDGTDRSVSVFFTDEIDCKFQKQNVFKAQVNCCPLTFDLGDDQNKCVGESVLLNAGDNGTTYNWKKDGVVIPGTTTSKTLPVNTTGTYEVEVIHSSGCKKTDRVVITFNPNPTINFPTNLEFCTGETFELKPSLVTNAVRYEWYKDNVIISGQTGQSIQITQGGNYRLVAFSNFNCRSQVDVTVKQVNAPVVDLGADQRKCEGEKAILDAGNDGTIFEWFFNNTKINGANASIYEAVQSGAYRVVVKNSTGCSTTDNIKVDFFASPKVEDFPALINICQGQTANITAVASGFNQVQWFRDNNPIPNSNFLSIPVTISGLYTIEASNIAQCKTRKSVQVEIRSLPVVNLGNPTLVSCIGNPVLLDAGTDGSSFKWKKDGVDLPETTKNLTVTTDGKYSVIVTNQFGCNNSDEITISFIQGPTVTLNGNATICEGETHLITMTANATNLEIRWFDENGNIIPGQTGPTLSVTKAGTYRVSVKGGTPACEVFKDVTITVNPRPALNLGNDRVLCDGDPAPVLNAGPNQTSYNWTLNGAPLATTQNVTATQSGLYKVTVRNSFNCERTEQVRITFEPKPTLLNINDTYDLCTGRSLFVNVSSNATKFEWKRNNIIINNQTSNTLEITQGGNYELIVTNAANCKNSKTFVVTSRSRPSVDLGADFSLCPGENKVLNAGTHAQYLWSDFSTAASLAVNAGQPTTLTKTEYRVTVTNQFGCTDADTVSVTVNPVVTANITADKPGVCNGEPVKLTASGGSLYKWTDSAGNTLGTQNESSVTVNPSKTAIYSVEVSDGVCPQNKAVKTIEIKVFEPVNVSAGMDTCVVLGRTVKLKATGGISYKWDNIDLIEGSANVADPVVKPVVETVFSVTVTDANGCIYTDDVKVCIKVETFKAIDMLTPNGDGKNDQLYFGDLSDYPDNQLRVFNRWGNLIFEAEGYQISGELFDGTKNGERLPADTYYYVLKYGDQVVKSALTILWD